MKCSDYIADFLARQGIRHVFAITGGASLHLIDSLAKHPDIHFICSQHEQAGAMAADAYSRATGNLGAAVATSGPGATNMITGVCCAYYDSVPVVYITGQVATFRLKRDMGVRQFGFQETSVVEMYRPITKYAVLVEDIRSLRYELEKAVYIARSGRPGPVLIDIPDDLQRGPMPDPETLETFAPASETRDRSALDKQVAECVRLCADAQRPVIILGWGVRLAGAEREALELVDRLGFPVVPTWAAMDLVPASDPRFVGAFGLHGTRYGNFTVQNADLVLSIGSRLDTHETGSPLSSFAREAKRIFVDVDGAELGKFKRFALEVDLPIEANARDFLEALNPRLRGFTSQDLTAWWARVRDWKRRYDICPPRYYAEGDLNPYVFVKTLSRVLPADEVMFADTGCAIAWMMQAFEFSGRQRLYSAFNNTPMGYGLPAAIGGSLALGHRQVTCITGDGGLQVNIQELATLLRHDLPIKILLFNNHGYSMVQQTQDAWLNSRYEATTIEGGLAFPDFVKVAQAYGYRTVTIRSNDEAEKRLREVYETPGPVFCNVEIRPEHRVIPQCSYGRPIEDAEPLLPRDEFLANMIVKPMPASLA